MCLIRGSFIECVTQAHKSISPVGDKVLSGAIKNLQQIVQHVSKNKLTCFITTEKNCQMFEIVYRHFTLIIYHILKKGMEKVEEKYFSDRTKNVCEKTSDKFEWCNTKWSSSTNLLDQFSNFAHLI
jgi:GTP1/Obg family GTP-binding protein